MDKGVCIRQGQGFRKVHEKREFAYEQSLEMPEKAVAYSGSEYAAGI